MSKESIKEIGSRLKMAEDAEREQLMKVYASDDRAGVQKLLEKYRKQKEKLQLYDEIMDKAVAVGLGMASPARIDEINILQATYEAMRQAIGNLKVEPDLLLNDAVTIPEV